MNDSYCGETVRVHIAAEGIMVAFCWLVVVSVMSALRLCNLQLVEGHEDDDDDLEDVEFEEMLGSNSTHHEANVIANS